MDLEGAGRRISARKNLISAIIIIASGYVLYTNVDLGRVFGTVLSADIGLYVVAMLLFYLTFPLRGYRWKLLLDNVGARTGTERSSRMIFVSFFLNTLVPAKLGDLYRAHAVQEEREVPRSRVLGTVMTCRLLDFGFLVLMLSLLGPFVLASRFGFLMSYLQWFYLAILVGLAGLYLVEERFLRFLPERLVGMIMEAKLGIRESMRVGVWRTMALTAVIWLLVAVRLYAVLLALDVSATFVFAAFLGFFMIALLAIPLTPGGLGVVEVISVSLLSVYGFDAELGASIVLLERSISFVSLVIIGAVYVALTDRELLEDYA